MSSRDFRKEPVFSGSDQAGEPVPGKVSNSSPPPPDGLDPRLRLAAFAVMFVCSVFFIEWTVQTYLEYRAVQTIRGAISELEASAEASALVARAERERARIAAEHRRAALREQRASTNQGKWLAKNCSDWRRAYEDIGAQTAQQEMRRHCQIYEKYLDSGIAVASVR